ncbi:MAG: recombinase family protein [Bdellovibrionaceae bacterium]|nr:recombinase family protein [Pseudobdellovibrionaceae bacterium]NUM59027.1 recombinase family protein [Pseudobdellovibrionaceae bacterium]
MTLRPNKSVSAEQISRQNFKSSTPPPFGYMYLEGRLQKNPKEFPTLQIIWQQWKLGQTASTITKYLNSKKLKTRNLKEWKRQTVLNILERFEKKLIVL